MRLKITVVSRRPGDDSGDHVGVLDVVVVVHMVGPLLMPAGMRDPGEEGFREGGGGDVVGADGLTRPNGVLHAESEHGVKYSRGHDAVVKYQIQVKTPKDIGHSHRISVFKSVR